MRSLPVAVILLLPATAAFAGPGDRCDHERVVERTLDAKGLAELSVHAEAGSLDVKGGDRDVVSVHARTCATSARLADEARLHVEGTGDSARVAVELPEATGWFGGNESVRMDLTIRVPRRLAVSVNDSSGSIEVHDVRSLRVNDGSGSLEVRTVAGDVQVNDGSGSIDVADVAGAVEIRDGSGSIDVEDVGSLALSDGSGSIEIARVRGDVTIAEDGSGSIAIADVGGSVRIDEDGSGSIRVRRVAGDLHVGSDGSGSVRHSGVRGRVSIPSAS